MANDHQIPDEQLIANYYACDDAAFDQLDRRYRQSLFGFFRRLGADPTVAADLTQKTLLKVLETKQGARYQPGGATFRTWLFQIAYHVWCDHLRRLGRRGRSQTIPEDGETPEERRESGKAPEAPIDPRPAAQALVVAQEFLEALKQCLAGLTDDRRTAFVLVYWLGLTAKEAARIMGRSENAVWQLIHHAIPDLRRCLEQRGFTTRAGLDDQAVRTARANGLDEAIRLLGNQTFARKNTTGGDGT